MKTKTISTASSATTNPAVTTRLLSVDILRGLTIAFMILVNNNGDERAAYWPLKHAAWNGFTPTDLVFPTFLFLVGISTVLSLESRLAHGIARQQLFLHIIRRTVILYLLGLLVNSFPFFNLHTMRFYGVLPRIAICYFLIGSLYLLSRDWRDKVAFAVAALAVYWVLMRFVAVPGYGMPTHDVPLLDRDGNLTAWLDRQIFTAPHLYERTRDPEGLLSTLPALGTALLGMLTGLWLRSTRTIRQKATGIAIAALTSILLGGLWNITFPINKKLWTSSYVLFAGGLSLLLLATAIALVDLPAAGESREAEHRRTRRFTPLLVFGKNAITAYVFSELLAGVLGSIHLHPGLNLQQAIYSAIHSMIPDAPLASLLYSLAFVAVCWLPISLLHRRGHFIKI